MKGSKWVCGICIVALLGVAGCSDDDDAGSFDGTFDEGTMQDLTQAVISPTTLIWNFFFFLPAKAQGLAKTLGEEECQDISEDYCFLGTATGCETYGRLSITFEECANGGSELNGSVTLDVTGKETFDAIYDLSFNTLQLNGTIPVDQSKGCLVEAIEQFSANTPFFNTTFDDGVIEYCGPDDYGTGTLELILNSSGADLLLVLTFNNSSQIGVAISELGSGDPVGSCLSDLDSGESSCKFL
jgi:hypothetical protein